MSFKWELKRYYLKISWGLIGYKNRKKSLEKLKNRIAGFLQLRPDSNMDTIYTKFGWPEEIIEAQKRCGRSDFWVSMKHIKPYEWVVVILGVLLVAWLIFCAFGGTIG